MSSNLTASAILPYIALPKAHLRKDVFVCVGEEIQDVDYDPAEHRMKHCGQSAQAEFEQCGSALIGKCPSTMSRELAKALVNDAVYDGIRPDQSIRALMPDRVWNVHEGVIYEAVPTREGAYHGYPWRGRPTRNRLPRPVKRILEARAKEQGFDRQFKDWLKEYES